MIGKLPERKRTGRPSDAYKHRFLRVLQQSKAMQRLQNILVQTQREDVFLDALKICLERGIGKVVDHVKMEDVTQGRKIVCVFPPGYIANKIKENESGGGTSNK